MNISHCVKTRRCSAQRLKSYVVPLLLGQVLAILIAATAICSTYLSNADANVPMNQNLWPYCLLAVCYNTVRVFRQRSARYASSNHSTHVHPSKGRNLRIFLYTVTGLIDTHANWALVAAYRFTSVTSVQLLDCLSIPATVLLSFLFLRHRYYVIHHIAILICLFGATGMVIIDATTNASPPVSNHSSPSNSSVKLDNNIILGDFLVVIGSVAYAFSNCLQQYLVVQYGLVDFLAFTSLSAILPTLLYSVLLEREKMLFIFTPSNPDFAIVVSCFSGYAVTMFALYSLMPYVLSRTSVVLVNLSLLTADVYALLMGVYLFHYRFSPFYLLCFAAILVGVALFSSRSPVVAKNHVKCLRCLDRFDMVSHVPGGYVTTNETTVETQSDIKT